MSRIEQFRLMARYNAWMNQKIYAAAAGLSAEALAQNRGAFFGSILGTLEHLVVADTLWLKRFAAHPAGDGLAPVVGLPMPTSLDQIQFGAYGPLKERRDMLDLLIERFVGGLEEADFDIALAYRNSKGLPFTKPFDLLLTHFFNHQTHHRGQTTTLLSQAGVGVDATDLLFLVPEAIVSR